MSDESNALLALKNAWAGAMTACEDVRVLTPAVMDLPADAPTSTWDLETVHRATLAQSNAVMALHGLVEEVRRRQAPAEAS